MQIELLVLAILQPFNCVQTNQLWLILKCYLQTIYLHIYITGSGIK